jgi:hypothetical protein
MQTQSDIELRLRRLEDRERIRALVDLYGIVMDERKIAGIRRLFAEDAVFATADGYISTTSLDELVAMYEGRFGASGATNHFAHGHIIRFDATDADLAYGIVNSHVEVARLGEPMIAAIRYHDTYVRAGEAWKFRKRLMTYMYYLNIRDYGEAMVRQDRVRVYGDARLADWPAAPGAAGDSSWLDPFLDEGA